MFQIIVCGYFAMTVIGDDGKLNTTSFTVAFPPIKDSLKGFVSVAASAACALIIDAENGMDAAFLYVPDAEKSSFSARLYNQNGELLAEKVLTRTETNELVIEFPGFESDQTLQLVVS